MKNIIIGLVIGLLLNGFIVYAKEQIIINPTQQINNYFNTTKIITPEGTYRIFIFYNGFANGITAIKIK